MTVAETSEESKAPAAFSREFVHSILVSPDSHYRELGKKAPSPGQIFGLVAVIFSGAFLFGAATGTYVAGHQIWITGLKVPALFLSTLAICAPSMYILSLLIGARLSMTQALAVALTSISVTAIILAGWAPVMLVFARTLQPHVYTHYTFLLLLSLVSVGSGAAISIWHLARGFDALAIPREVRWRVILVWLLLYQFVGAQITWLLRPFVGSSSDTIRFEGNFYEAVPVIIENFFNRLIGDYYG
ncbi:MAG: hypothetical protein ACYS8W_10765 [Planctomycetota bacterium]|jgi:hypothetical protein